MPLYTGSLRIAFKTLPLKCLAFLSLNDLKVSHFVYEKRGKNVEQFKQCKYLCNI